MANCTFQHLGAGALQFEGGAHLNSVTGSIFTDISGAAIQLGRYDTFNETNPRNQEVGNVFTNNWIDNVATE